MEHYKKQIISITNISKVYAKLILTTPGVASSFIIIQFQIRLPSSGMKATITRITSPLKVGAGLIVTVWSKKGLKPSLFFFSIIQIGCN